MSNHLIASLPRAARAHFVSQCDEVNLTFGDVLCEPHQRFRHLYFPLTGFVSLMTSVNGHPPLEMGMIGSEGMLGATMLLGIDVASLQGVVQGSGTALRMTTTVFNKALVERPDFRRTLHRYLYVLIEQLSQIGACSRFHEIEARLARWLLMTHDRAHADHFHLTHGYLGDMLGVQRSAVTIAAGTLRDQGLIRYARGEIEVLDRKGLERAACECYSAVVHDYQHWLG